MAVVFREGFDTYNGSGVAPGLGATWTVNGAGNTSIQAGRITGRCVRGRNSSALGTNNTYIEKTFSAIGTNAALGVAVMVENVATLGTDVFIDLGSEFRLAFRNGGTVAIFRGATQLAVTSTAIVASGTWNYFEVELTISATVGYVRVYRNGEPITDLSITNGNTGTASIARIAFDTRGSNAGNAARSYVSIDDIYIVDTNVRLGERTIETLYLVSDGSTLMLVPSTGTDHFAVVDETQANTTDYLTGTNVGDLDLLGLGNLSSNPQTIDEVNIIVWALKTDAGTRAIKAGVKSGSTTSDGPDLFLATTIQKFDRPLALNPNGNVPWTKAAVDALELQPKVSI